MNGAEVVFDWPAPEQRPDALALDVYKDLEPLLPEDENPLRWLNGVTWTPWGCDDTTSRVLDDDCSPTAQTWTAPLGFGTALVFDAFRIEVAFVCSVLGGMGVDGEKLRAKALEVTAQDRSRQVARQVMFGQPVTSNPDFSEGTVATVSTSDTTPIGALAAVENGLATRLNNARGMVHMSPAMFTYLTDGGAIKFRGGQWLTSTGHRVVADAGYVGAGGQAGQDWIFGSGDVHYVTSPLELLGETWENFDHLTERDNRAIARAEQYVLAVFETCPLVKARSDIVLSPVGI